MSSHKGIADKNCHREIASHPLEWTLKNLKINNRLDAEKTETCTLQMKM